jgi:hypothetical protein
VRRCRSRCRVPAYANLIGLWILCCRVSFIFMTRYANYWWWLDEFSGENREIVFDELKFMPGPKSGAHTSRKLVSWVVLVPLRMIWTLHPSRRANNNNKNLVLDLTFYVATIQLCPFLRNWTFISHCWTQSQRDGCWKLNLKRERERGVQSPWHHVLPPIKHPWWSVDESLCSTLYVLLVISIHALHAAVNVASICMHGWWHR